MHYFRLIRLLPLLFLGYLSKLSAQDSLNAAGKVSIASPTAASLGKYGDIPVSYHTGIPQIDIPIYTVKAGGLSLPISLGYHASGLKVMEPASWVGAGWSLNAGGVITRSVVGLPDEKITNTGSVEEKGHFSDYGYSNYIYSSGIEDWLGFSAGRKDGEPDLFFFNFGGYTGKFYFRDDRTPVLVPQQDLQIIPYFPADTMSSFSVVNGDASIQGFTVVTPDGTRYLFGKTPGFTGTAPFEVTTPYTAQNGGGGYIISSWYLNKIQSADGQFSIMLNYTQENYGYFTLSTFSFMPGYNSTMWGTPYDYNLVKNLINGVRLSNITFPNGAVNFTPGATRTDLSSTYPSAFIDTVNTQAASLGAIQITDSAGFCKKYQFFYGYFTDNTTAQPGYFGTAGSYTLFTDKQRLRLDSVREITCDSSIRIPPYKFTYYAEKVPRRLTFAQDHWGFYNGATGNSTMVPTYTLNGVVVNGANRDASWPAMRGGALTKISYPTGGSTTFNFEPHLVSSTVYSTGTGTLVNLQAHLYSQSNTIDSGAFYNNGNLLSLDLDNTTAWNCTFYIKDASYTTVYTYPIGNNTHLTPTFTLPAGSYKAFVVINYSPGSTVTGGISAKLQQTITISGIVNTPVGGLRIGSMVTADNAGGASQTTSFSYTNSSGMSTAVLYSKPVYVQQLRNDLIANLGYFSLQGGQPSFQSGAGNINGCISVLGGEYLVSAGSVRPLSTVQGNHIGYQTVTVSRAGNGYSVYNYYININGFADSITDVCVRTASTGSGCNPGAPNFPSPPAPFDYKRGELYYEQHYNNSGQLLKNIFYYPTYDATSFLPTPGFTVYPFGTPSGSVLLGTKYQIATVRKTKMMVVEDDLDANGGPVLTTTKITYYGSPYHNAPTRTVTTTSSGDSLVQNTKYAFDFRLPGCDSINDCSQPYYATCASCLTTYNQRTSCGSNANCLFTYYLNYQQCLINARASYDSCRKVNFMNTTNFFATCHTSKKNAADGVLKPILRLQDEFYNAPIEMTEWKNLNLRHATFTRYDTSISPLGFAYPGKIQLINLQTPSATFTTATVSANTLSKDSRYTDEQSLTISKGNPQQVTAKDGISVSYIWDYRNTQPVAKTVNAAADQVAYTSFESDGTGGWTIPSPNRDTGAVTGSKSYNLSYGACSRPGLTASNSYKVSYWSKTGASFTVTGSIAVIQGKYVRGWTYFEHTVTGVTTASISAASGGIDELRLYPALARMTTYTYSPLVGMTSQTDPNSRPTYYGYDGLGRLKAIRDMDGNYLKVYDYKYGQYMSNAASWEVTGQLRCKPCSANPGYVVNMQQHEEKDMNPGSPTYNTSRWIDDGIPGSCVIAPGWQNTATAPRCVQSNGTNTGYQEQEQKDMNPCSSTYNQTRWTSLGQNLTACPYNCNGTNCTGNNHKCVNSVCQTGTLGVISRNQSGTGINAKCTTSWGYFFSDGTYKFDHFTTTPGNCPINP